MPIDPMATSSSEPRSRESLSDDPRWQLVERVRAGPLQSARRLQQLLGYLAERTLLAPGVHVSEEQIGVAVFERAPGYDTSVDTIVRVQVSQLRRKLEHYFVSEGRDAPLVIEVPKGTYVLEFHPRTAGAAAVVPNVAVAPASSAVTGASTSRRVSAFGVVMALLVAVLAFDDVRLRRGAPEKTPHLAHFWRQFLANGHPVHVVLSDASVPLLSDALRRPVPLGDYRRASYPWSLTEALAADPRLKQVLEQASVKAFTTTQDARVARDVSAACSRHGAAPTIVSARDLQLDLNASENLVLLGSRRANPWMEPFDPALNFRYTFDETRRAARVANTAPAPGEEPAYAVDWGRRSYCVVAFLPKPRGQGHTLLLQGADVLAVSACGLLVTDEPALASVYSRLGLDTRRAVPHFEILLKTALAGDAATDYEVVAHRVIVTPERR